MIPVVAADGLKVFVGGKKKIVSALSPSLIKCTTHCIQCRSQEYNEQHSVNSAGVRSIRYNISYTVHKSEIFVSGNSF